MPENTPKTEGNIITALHERLHAELVGKHR
jgi:hypothetical protein